MDSPTPTPYPPEKGEADRKQARKVFLTFDLKHAGSRGSEMRWQRQLRGRAEQAAGETCFPER